MRKRSLAAPSGANPSRLNGFLNSPIVVAVCIFLIKLASVSYLISLTKCLNPESMAGLASIAGDTPSYIEPIDNFIREGSYYFGDARAGRMPYVGLTYLPFRLFLSREISLSIVVLLQVVLETVAIIFMAKLCRAVLRRTEAFWLFLILSCASLNVTIYDIHILSEAFGIGFLCLFAHHYYRFLSERRTNGQLFLTGLMLASAVLFKPYMSLLFLLIGGEFIIYALRFRGAAVRAMSVLRWTMVVSVPLVVLDAPWAMRNYIEFSRFIPFQQDRFAGFKYSPADKAVTNFIESIGDSKVFWDKRSAGCFFIPQDDIPCEYQIPNRIFGPRLTRDRIEEGRRLHAEYLKTSDPALGTMVVKKFDWLTQTYRDEHPVFSKLGTPFLLIKKFLIHSGSYYLPVKRGTTCFRSHQMLLKVSQSLLYYLNLIAGFIGVFWLLRQNANAYIIPCVPLYLIALFPLYFRVSEFRYFHMAYPFLMIGTCLVIIRFTDRLFPIVARPPLGPTLR